MSVSTTTEPFVTHADAAATGSGAPAGSDGAAADETVTVRSASSGRGGRRGGLRQRLAPAGEAGMTTAEYAVGTVAACGFGGVLWAVVHSAAVHSLLQSVLERALHLQF